MSKQLVIDTLKNNHTQRINFTYIGSTGFVFRVMPGDFTTVVLNIQQGNINVRDARGIYVDTPTLNRKGRDFYEAVGYSFGYEMPRYYEDNLDGVTYQKFFADD